MPFSHRSACDRCSRGAGRIERSSEHRSFAASICGTATRPSSNRWGSTGNSGCSTSSCAWASRKSRSGFRQLRRPNSSSSAADRGERIPDDVTIQVLTQARDDLIAARSRRSPARESHRSPLQLDVAPAAAGRVRPRPRRHHRHRRAGGRTSLAEPHDVAAARDVRLEYSPESFTGTELAFAKEIARRSWRLGSDADGDHPEPAGDGRDVDAQRIRRSDRVVGRNIATATRFSASTPTTTAERPSRRRSSPSWPAPTASKGLFRQRRAHGQRRLVTLALNLFTQGVDPGSRCHDVRSGIVKDCNRLPIHPRHPMWAISSSRRSPGRTRMRSRKAWRRWRRPTVCLTIHRSFQVLL